MDAQLIDKIYESCFAPEIWPDVLDELGRIADAPGASLFVSRGEVLNWVTSPEPRERAERIVKEGWLWRGTIIARLFAQRHAGFLIDVEYLTPEELDHEPIYRDVWRPRGVGWGMGTAIPIPTGEKATFILSRRMELGPFERPSADRLDELRPHLARSVMISARLATREGARRRRGSCRDRRSGAGFQRDRQGPVRQCSDRDDDGLCPLGRL
jgi:hypothetical protein